MTNTTNNPLVDLLNFLYDHAGHSARVIISKHLGGYRIEAQWMKNGTLINIAEPISLYELSGANIDVWELKTQRIIDKVKKL